MPFNPNIPQPTDFLSDSQDDFLKNNLQLDTSFGIDHFPFSNLTADNGKHKQVTTPYLVGAVHRTTTATQTAYYPMKDGSLPILQYIRGWDTANAVSGTPSPINYLQSSTVALTTPGGVTNLPLGDMTGITEAVGTLYATSGDAVNVASQFFIVVDFFWRGAALTNYYVKTVSTGLAQSNWSMTNNLAIINLTGGSGTPVTGDIYWSLKFHRIII